MFEVSTLKKTRLLSLLATAFRKITFVVMAVIALGIISPAMADESTESTDSSPSANGSNLWDTLRYSFKLEEQYKRPEVQNQFNWLVNHKSYLNQLGEHSQPYLYYILQETKKRGMPGEIALLPMIESTYNPFAYSTSGAAGLWQFTKGTGNNFGLKQNWWFDSRRDIYKSTNAALDYLCYLHRFFNGNWILAIAAYHSGEGTVQRAVQYNGHHQRSTNFWSLNLPEDTHSYVPKLLALAKLIQSQNKASAKLPYISNTPYFTRINVGTQIDLTNAAHLAGISYPEFLKLNPGNNRWATSPSGPHMIVLPLDKVDVFVHNLKKIPQKQRSNLLAKHAVHFDTDLEAVPETATIDKIVSDEVSSQPATLKKPIVYASPIPQKSATPAKPAPAQVVSSSTTASPNVPANHASMHKVLHVVQKGDSFWHLTHQYHVTESDIRSWNNMSAKAFLQQGAKLTLWTANNMQWKNNRSNNSTTNIIHYKIRSGDSLTGIARKYKVPVKKIMTWNTKLEAKRLIPGKEIVIYL